VISASVCLVFLDSSGVILNPHLFLPHDGSLLALSSFRLASSGCTSERTVYPVAFCNGILQLVDIWIYSGPHDSRWI
jgi:hypothetical protein